MSKLEAFLGQFRIVSCDYRHYFERDGVLYNEGAVTRMAQAAGIPATAKRVRDILVFQGGQQTSSYASGDLRAQVVGAFPLQGRYNGQSGVFYIVNDGMVFIPEDGDPIAFGGERPQGVYHFAGAGDGRDLDFTGTEEDFWAYWEVATSPLEWGAKVSAAVFLPVLLGQTSGGWVFVDGDWGAQEQVFTGLIFLVWGRFPVPVAGEGFSMPLWSDAHLDYIAETGLVGLLSLEGKPSAALERAAMALGKSPLDRHRVGIVCGERHTIPPNVAPSLLRVPFQPQKQTDGKLSPEVSLGLIQPKALMGAFRLFQRAAKMPYPPHPVYALSGWGRKWGMWALKYAEVLGVREEVSGLFMDYVRQVAVSVPTLFAIRKFFASPLFVPNKRYTLSDIQAIGGLSDSEVSELERTTFTLDGPRVLSWVADELGFRVTMYPKTQYSPLRFSFRPLKRAGVPEKNGRSPHPKRQKGGKRGGKTPKRTAK